MTDRGKETIEAEVIRQGLITSELKPSMHFIHSYNTNIDRKENTS